MTKISCLNYKMNCLGGQHQQLCVRGPPCVCRVGRNRQTSHYRNILHEIADRPSSVLLPAVLRDSTLQVSQGEGGTLRQIRFVLNKAMSMIVTQRLNSMTCDYSKTRITTCCGRAGVEISAGGGKGAVATLEITELRAR